MYCTHQRVPSFICIRLILPSYTFFSSRHLIFVLYLPAVLFCVFYSPVVRYHLYIYFVKNSCTLLLIVITSGYTSTNGFIFQWVPISVLYSSAGTNHSRYQSMKRGSPLRFWQGINKTSKGILFS
jgi:hypothetical protein